MTTITVTIGENDWTYTEEEANDAILWLRKDAAYLIKQARTYRNSGDLWLASQVAENAKWSKSCANKIRAAKKALEA